MPNLFNDINDKQATLYNVNIAVNLKKTASSAKECQEKSLRPTCTGSEGGL